MQAIRVRALRDNMTENETEIFILYDGECPFCSRYVRMTRLSHAMEHVHLLNLREHANHRLVQEASSLGLDFNAGMVVAHNQQFFHGADAMHYLALITTYSGVFNAIMRMVFRNKRASRLLYPALRACRNLTLRVLGVAPI